MTAIPAFCAIASTLRIRWCALTDEDRHEDGTINPNTEKCRQMIEGYRTEADVQIEWPGNLDKALKVAKGKATPDAVIPKLGDAEWRTTYPDFARTIDGAAKWLHQVFS